MWVLALSLCAPHMCRNLWSPEEGVGYLELDLRCKPHNVGNRNQTQSLYRQ